MKANLIFYSANKRARLFFTGHEQVRILIYVLLYEFNYIFWLFSILYLVSFLDNLDYY